APLRRRARQRSTVLTHNFSGHHPLQRHVVPDVTYTQPKGSIMAKPVNTKATSTVQAEEKAKRKMLTPEERIAKIEAELAAAKAKAGDKDRKEQARLREQIAALSERKA